MGKLHTRVNFSVVNKLVVPVLFGRIFINRSILFIYTAEGKIVPQHSPPVTILKVHETRRETDMNNAETRQADKGTLALLAKITRSGLEYNTVR